MVKPSLLLPGCERQPARPNLTYVPPNSEPHTVVTGEDWWKLAKLPQVVAARLDALGLCEFNFGTRVPAEINWYLRNKVGCIKATPDRKNYMFTSGLTPGKVYLPKPGTAVVRPPSPAPPLPPANKLKLNSWIGLGGKLGTTVVVTGIEQVGGFLVSIQDLVNQEKEIRTIALNAQTTRLGLGVGASGGACVIFASSLKNPGDLNRLMSGGMDFSLALGGNAGALVKAAKVKKFQPLIKVLVAIGAKTPAALQTALKQPDKLADLYKAVTALRDTLGSETEASEPSVIMVDIPYASGGTEVAVFHAVTEFRVLGQPTITADWENAD